MKYPARIAGFTLIELMLTIIIVAILAVMAYPIYLNYTIRSYYTEIVSAADPYKYGVIECYQSRGTLTGCNGGTYHIPANFSSTTGNIRRIRVANGVITITPAATHGILTSDRYVLTPRVSNSKLVWTASGAGVTKGYAR